MMKHEMAVAFLIIITGIMRTVSGEGVTSPDTASSVYHQFSPPQQAEPSLAAKEIRLIVRFTSTVAEKIPDQVTDTKAVVDVLPNMLGQLATQGQVLSMERLFPSSRWGSTNSDLSSDQKKHLAQRKRRATSRKSIPLGNIFHLSVSGVQIDSLLQKLRGHPDVVYAHEDVLVHTMVTPNDPGYPSQWALHNTGQTYPASGSYNTPPGTPDADMDAPEAWDVFSSSDEVIVAVVDTGVDYLHRDLAASMWINPLEASGLPDVDDDNNGYVDDLNGYNFVTDESDPLDDNGHGTHCAGIIGATHNNALDVSGICPTAKIMALKSHQASGTGSLNDSMEAIVYAADNGADIISCSWGVVSSLGYDALNDAVEYAVDQGCVVMASAGNDDLDYISWPAFHADVIGVTASDSNDSQASFNNYGCWLDVAAPGVDILGLRASGTSRGTIQNDYTTVLSGTSMACPYASGVAALVLAQNPTLVVEEVRALLKATSDQVSATEYIGQGRINAYQALLNSDVSLVSRLDWANIKWDEIRSGGDVELYGTATSSDFDRFEIWWGEGVAPVHWNLFRSVDSPVVEDVLISDFDTVEMWDGLFSVRLSVYTQSGLRADSAHLINIQNYKQIQPMHNDVLRLDGELLPLRFSLPATASVTSINWGEDFNPATWSSVGVAVLDGTDDLWGTLDTSMFSGAPLLNLRYTISTPYGPHEEYVEMFWLNEQLKPGFPVFTPKLTNFFPYEHMCDLLVEDLDGDGTCESCIQNPSTDSSIPSEVVIVDAKGQIFGRCVAENGGLPSGDKPAIGKLDGTGGYDLITQMGATPGNLYRLYAWNANGQNAQGNWPIDLGDAMLQKVLADLDRDGNLEIFWDSGGNRELTVLGHLGEVLNTANLETISVGFEPSPYPAVGQFDSDPELEIAIRYSLKQVAIMDPDGSLLPGWPYDCPGLINDMAVGDVDNDGFEDLVVLDGKDFSTGDSGSGLSILSNNGTLLYTSPPELSTESYQYSGLSLADFDGDDDLEIAFTSYGRVFLYHHTGEKALGDWPKIEKNTWFTRGGQIGDLTGDGVPDILAAGGGMNYTFSNGTDFDYSGGLYAWEFDGTPIDLNPHPGTTILLLPDGNWKRSATIADIDNNGLTDIVVSSYFEGGYGKKSRSLSKERIAIYAFELPVTWDPQAAQWPMPDHNTRSSSNFSGIDLSPLANQYPALLPEPEMTLGSSNTVSWAPLWFTEEYYVEAATSADFLLPVASSGWISETEFDLENLPVNTTLYFRVKGRYPTSLRTVETAWSQTESTHQVERRNIWVIE